jgi:hypothetical protein
MKNFYRSLIKKIFVPSAAVLVFLGICGSEISGQVWNPNAGGYNGGYGLVYRSLGEALATKNMQDALNRSIQTSILRQSVTRSGRPGSAASTMGKRQQPAAVGSSVFKPVAGVDTGKRLADGIGETREEKVLIRQIYIETKKAFEAEGAKMGWKNNVSGALAFFTAAAVAVHSDGEEISEAGLKALFEAIDSTFNESQITAKMPDREKQELYNTLIGFSGLLIAGYSHGQESNDAETVEEYKKLAGELTMLVLGIDPNSLTVADGYVVRRGGNE